MRSFDFYLSLICPADPVGVVEIPAPKTPETRGLGPRQFGVGRPIMNTGIMFGGPSGPLHGGAKGFDDAKIQQRTESDAGSTPAGPIRCQYRRIGE